MYGVKADVVNSVHFLDNHRFLYPCGHNIVIFNQEDKSQKFIPGVEGSEGISSLALSNSKRFLAVCEKAKQALCIIYDLQGVSHGQQPKRKKILTSHDYYAKEFVSAVFSPHHEKINIATLTAPFVQCDEKGNSEGLIGESKIILWNWEKSRCVAVMVLPFNETTLPNQISYSINDQAVLLVTGKNTYRFFRMQETHQMKVIHTAIQKKDLAISTNYTCHTWLSDGRILICNDQGDIVLLESTGDFKMVLSESPG